MVMLLANAKRHQLGGYVSRGVKFNAPAMF